MNIIEYIMNEGQQKKEERMAFSGSGNSQRTCVVSTGRRGATIRMSADTTKGASCKW